MTRKRFVKKIMSEGFSKYEADRVVQAYLNSSNMSYQDFYKNQWWIVKISLITRKCSCSLRQATRRAEQISRQVTILGINLI